MKKILLQLSLLLVSSFVFAQEQFVLNEKIQNSTTIISNGESPQAIRSNGDLILGGTTEDLGSVVTLQGQQTIGTGYFVVEGNLILKEGAVLALEKNTLLIVVGDLIVEGNDIIVDIEKESYMVVNGKIDGEGKGFMLGAPDVYTNANPNFVLEDVEFTPISALPHDNISFDSKDILELVKFELGWSISDEFHYFEGFSMEDQILLSWEIKATEEPAYFSLEKSETGREWEVVEVITSNFDSELKEYSFVDDFLTDEVNHYRITMVDKDGNISKTMETIVEAELNSKEVEVLSSK